MSNGNTIPGTGLRVRSPLTNARDVSRQYDGTSLSPKALTDLASAAIARRTAPGADGVIELDVPITGILFILSFLTATGVASSAAGIVQYPQDPTHFTVVNKNANGRGEVREAASTDWSAHTWLIFYQPDAPDIDIPQNQASTVFSPLPLA